MNKFLSFILSFLTVIPLGAQRPYTATIRNDSLATSYQPARKTHDYDWLIETLSKSCKYPIKLQKKNQEAILLVVYEVSKNGYITRPTVVHVNHRMFKKAALEAFKAVRNISTALPAGKDTLQFQFKLDIPTTLVHPHTDVLILGYSTCDIPVLMR